MPESFRNTIDRLHPIRIGAAVKPPTKLKDVQPVYPEAAMGSKLQGTVIVEAIIDGSGAVADTRIVRGVPEFNDAALKAVSQWEFTPTLLNGEPTAIICTVTVTFQLR
jgi:protein TonB